MKALEDLLRKLADEHQILKEMQEKVMENYDLVTQNERQMAENQETVILNQKTIIRNQEIIVGNQTNIIRNQKQIVQNQVTLDVILQVQAQLLNLAKRLNGEVESIHDTEVHIEQLRDNSRERLRFKAFNEPNPL
ncbi:MAG: hypothetical protein MUE30_06905 [Spirosomaceae bacterium]|jgi:predicted nucleic-acid-binding protein|nr:hypothetical protein [Spirosomataceae bacterium]